MKWVNRVIETRLIALWELVKEPEASVTRLHGGRGKLTQEPEASLAKLHLTRGCSSWRRNKPVRRKAHSARDRAAHIIDDIVPPLALCHPKFRIAGTGRRQHLSHMWFCVATRTYPQQILWSRISVLEQTVTLVMYGPKHRARHHFGSTGCQNASRSMMSTMTGPMMHTKMGSMRTVGYLRTEERQSLQP